MDKRYRIVLEGNAVYSEDISIAKAGNIGDWMAELSKYSSTCSPILPPNALMCLVNRGLTSIAVELAIPKLSFEYYNEEGKLKREIWEVALKPQALILTRNGTGALADVGLVTLLDREAGTVAESPYPNVYDNGRFCTGGMRLRIPTSTPWPAYLAAFLTAMEQSTWNGDLPHPMHKFLDDNGLAKLTDTKADKEYQYAPLHGGRGPTTLQGIMEWMINSL